MGVRRCGRDAWMVLPYKRDGAPSRFHRVAWIIRTVEAGMSAVRSGVRAVNV
jgi:hypothetical protein